jgi:hypothetical protein
MNTCSCGLNTGGNMSRVLQVCDERGGGDEDGQRRALLSPEVLCVQEVWRGPAAGAGGPARWAALLPQVRAHREPQARGQGCHQGHGLPLRVGARGRDSVPRMVFSWCWLPSILVLPLSHASMVLSCSKLLLHCMLNAMTCSGYGRGKGQLVTEVRLN